MQKQIFNFPTVNVPLPTDLFLISHSGLTSNITLNTVSSYTINRLGNFLSPVNTNISSLSSLQTNANTNVLLLSANLLNLNTQNSLVSSNLLKLSAFVDTIDINSISNPLISKINSNVSQLSSEVDTLSSYYNKLSSNFVAQTSPFYTLSANTLTLSSKFNNLYTGINVLSSFLDSISASQVSLITVVKDLTSTNPLNPQITFTNNEIIGQGSLTISPTGTLYITTSGDSVNTWSFNGKGQLSIPGNLIFNSNSTNGGPYISPVNLDLSLTVQKLNHGIYNLANGVEGQIMYFVPKPHSIGDTLTQIYIQNARYWIIDGFGHKLAVETPFYWVPWVLSNHRLDPVYDIFPSIATAIFTDGAWNISTGGRD